MSNCEPLSQQLALIAIQADKARIPSYLAWLSGFFHPVFFFFGDDGFSFFWGAAILESPTVAVYCGVFRVAEMYS